MTVSIDGFEIDAMITVAPSHTAQLTTDPVERGADINDHMIVGPTTVTIQGVVSDTPLSRVIRSDYVKPSVEAYALLVAIQQEKSLVEIISGVYPPFKEMALTSLSAPKSVDTGDALEFTVTFQGVVVVDVSSESKTTLVALPREQKKKNKGTQAAPEVVEPAESVETKTSTKSRSFLDKGLQWGADRVVNG